MRRAVQQDPIWHEGWFDARDGAPLWDDAHPTYCAGWLAYWRARELLAAFVAAQNENATSLT